MLDKEWSCRAIPKSFPFSPHGPFLCSLVSRNYWPAVEKCSFTLVPRVAMKEMGASTTTCTFIWGAELPLTPAVWHKGPGAQQGHRASPGLPPSAEANKWTKARIFSPLCLNTKVRPKEGAASSSLSPLSHSLVPLRAMLHPFPLSDSKDLCWDFRSHYSLPQSMALAHLPFGFGSCHQNF